MAIHSLLQVYSLTCCFSVLRQSIFAHFIPKLTRLSCDHCALLCSLPLSALFCSLCSCVYCAFLCSGCSVLLTLLSSAHWAVPFYFEHPLVKNLTFIHSSIYIAPFQVNYSEGLPTLAWPKRTFFKWIECFILFYWSLDFYSASSSYLLRSAPDYSVDTALEFHSWLTTSWLPVLRNL